MELSSDNINQLTLQPFIGVGAFKLGISEELIINKHDFKFKIEYDATNWITFESEFLGLNLYFEQHQLISILCFKMLLYRGKNILGLTLSEFIDLAEIKTISLPDIIDVSDYEYQMVYEIDELGLQLWVENNEIVSVFVSFEFTD